MLQQVLRKVFGTQNERDLKRLQPMVPTINDREPALRALSDEDLRGRTTTLRPTGSRRAYATKRSSLESAGDWKPNGSGSGARTSNAASDVRPATARGLPTFTCTNSERPVRDHDQ